MRRILTATTLCLMLADCVPTPASPEPSFRQLNPTPAVAVLQPDTLPPATGETDTSDTANPALTPPNGSPLAFEGVAFDSRSHRLVVVDQTAGPGSTFSGASAAAASRHGIAAINGGFFTPEGAPLGLVVSSGDARGQWNAASSLGSGVFFESGDGRMQLTRRTELDPAKAMTMRELLQAGPVLVDNGRASDGLEATKASPRTVMLWDGKFRWWIGQTSRCTLDELAETLANKPPVGWDIHHALNLDGGSSCELWISAKVQGGPLTRRGLFNKPVRNFLVLVPR